MIELYTCLEAAEIIRDMERQLHTQYVYLLYRPDAELPFYIGKGVRYRINAHRRKRGDYLVQLDSFHMRSDDALDRERELISEFRSKGIPIENIADGGEGGSFPLATERSNGPAQRQSKREKALKQWATRRDDMIKGIRAACSTPEFSAKMSLVRLHQRRG
jgi:hypothetical protein